jgi:hypothetical protein
MRITTMAGLAVAAAAAAVAVGGAAYASGLGDDPAAEQIVRIVTDDRGTDGRDCPDEGGTGTPEEAL